MKTMNNSFTTNNTVTKDTNIKDLNTDESKKIIGKTKEKTRNIIKDIKLPNSRIRGYTF